MVHDQVHKHQNILRTVSKQDRTGRRRMSPITALVVIITLPLHLLLSINAHSIPCSYSFNLFVQRRNISHCKKLTTLGAEFGWEYSAHNESNIHIVFGTRLHAEMGWLAWGVNPGRRPQMAGTRAIIGIRYPNGSTISDTYNVTSYTKLGCRLLPSDIDVGVLTMTLEFVAAIDYFVLYASLVLPSSYDISRLNHVWQVGYHAEGLEPKMHLATLQNVDSTEMIDLKTGAVVHVGRTVGYLRMVHGILNIVGWGTFLPVGVIVARYVKYPLERKEWWLSLHMTCQIVGYTIGTAGWIIGMWLGHHSRDYSFKKHRIFAIFILTFTTLQMLALSLRPRKSDQDQGKYWSMYHHFLGYSLLIVISINIFEGIAILHSHSIWKWSYIGILGTFAVVVITFEIWTWIKFKTTKGQDQDKAQPESTKKPGENSTKQDDQKVILKP